MRALSVECKAGGTPALPDCALPIVLPHCARTGMVNTYLKEIDRGMVVNMVHIITTGVD